MITSLRTVALAVVLVAAATPAAEVTRLKPDEQIDFYPTPGQRVPGENAWKLEIRGCVFEPERRRTALALFREAMELKDVELSTAEQITFRERARLFLADHERGKRVFVRIGDKVYSIGKSGADGNFAGEVLLADSEAQKLRRRAADGSWLPFVAELPSGDSRRFAGQALLLEETGVSVISDIDDTIKITAVRDRRVMLRNTFLREFQPAPGMAEFYQTLARSNAATFHYVSASPWQLHPTLAEFVQANGFPAGTFHLKEFRWKDRSFFSLFSDPERYKLGVIEPLLKRFPKRRFILVGDSGERDPEIYAKLAGRFPAQIAGIYIRDVTGETAESRRYREVFRGIARDVWRVFREPGDMVEATSP
jgi:hypothetical protein